jgi:HK97 family phage portal protein
MSLYAASRGLSVKSQVIGDVGSLSQPSKFLVEAFRGGKKTPAGIVVDEQNTVGLSAIFDGIRLLAESEAQLPLKVMRTDAQGNARPFVNHPAYILLNREPNPYISSFQLRKWRVRQEKMSGNAFIVIERNFRNDPIALWPVESRRVTVMIDTNRIRYFVDGDVEIDYEDMLHFVGYTENGYIGIPLITIAAASLGHMIATETFGSRFFGNGANISGIIKSKRYLKDQAAVDRVKSSFIAQTSGMDNAMSIALLEDDMDWERLGVAPEEAQFLGSRQFNIAEVARWLNVPVPMLKELGRATFGNIEHLDIQFVKYSLEPQLIATEQQYERKLLRMAERAGDSVFIKHNVKGLLRGDSNARANWYRTMTSIGAYSPNDVLRHEDEPTYNGGDLHFVHSGATNIENVENTIP